MKYRYPPKLSQVSCLLVNSVSYSVLRNKETASRKITARRTSEQFLTTALYWGVKSIMRIARWLTLLMAVGESRSSAWRIDEIPW